MSDTERADLAVYWAMHRSKKTLSTGHHKAAFLFGGQDARLFFGGMPTMRNDREHLSAAAETKGDGGSFRGDGVDDVTEANRVQKVRVQKVPPNN